MANKNRSNIFAEPVEDTDEEIVVAQPAPLEVGLKRARVKGTWLMYWGRKPYNFEDGKTYHLPADLYQYLKKNGNIYDTL